MSQINNLIFHLKKLGKKKKVNPKHKEGKINNKVINIKAGVNEIENIKQ